MNLFYEDYPESIIVGEEEIPIVTDFRNYIQLLDMLKDDGITSLEKSEILLQYFRKRPSDFCLAVDALIEFTTMESVPHCGSGGNETENGNVNQKELYSYRIDFPFIFSAFLRDYNINLRTISYMHWWEFNMLLNGLSDDTEIKQRIAYRSVNLNEIKDKDERKRIEKIQKLIRLSGNEPNDFDIGDAFGW